MARQVYTHKVLEAHNLTGDLSFTVPASQRLVIRDVAWYANNSGVSQSYYYAFGPAGGTFVWFVVDAMTTVMHHEEARYVFDPGDVVTFHADAASDLLVSGYLLDLP
jgi:hypothetical protein